MTKCEALEKPLDTVILRRIDEKCIIRRTDYNEYGRIETQRDRVYRHRKLTVANNRDNYKYDGTNDENYQQNTTKYLNDKTTIVWIRSMLVVTCIERHFLVESRISEEAVLNYVPIRECVIIVLLIAQ